MPQRVGVLLVHGIGEQKRGDGIFEWAEALARWYDGWLRGAGIWHVHHDVPPDALQAGQGRGFRAYVASLQAEIARVARARATRSRHDPPVAPPPLPEWLGGLCTLTDVQVERDPRDPDLPARAQLQLQRFRVNGSSVVDTVQLAEAHWADAFPVPRFGEFVSWTARNLPLILEAHLAWGLFQSSARFAKARTRGDRLRHLVEVVGWYAASLLLPVIPLVGIALLLLSIPLRWVPIEAAQNLARAIRNVMANVVGDSYVLLERPARASAMYERVAKALEWLTIECDAVVVVAHSQGAAMTLKVLADRDWSNVATLVTLGSGARKLAHLRAVANGNAEGSWWSAWLAVLLPWFVVLTVADLSRGVTPSWISLALVAGVIVWFLSSRARMGQKDPLVADDTWARHLRSVRVQWRDLYARTDPVSNGEHLVPGVSGPGPIKLKSVEVHNRGSLVGDHTSYWQNTQQCLPRIARSINDSLDWPLGSLTPVDDAALGAAWLARLGRVSGLRVVRTVIWATFVHFLLSGAVYLRQFGEGLRDAVHAAPFEIPAWILRLASAALDWNFGLGRMEFAGAALLAVLVAGVQWLWNRIWEALDTEAAKEMYVRQAGMIGLPLDLQAMMAIVVTLATQGGSLLTSSVPAPALLSLETLVLVGMFLFNLSDIGYLAKYFWITARRHARAENA